MKPYAIEYIRPENLLQRKTGIGGLSDMIIQNAQTTANSLVIDSSHYAFSKIKIMKLQLDSDNFIKANDDNAIDGFLHNLVPFDVSAKIVKNKALSTISNNLLKFIEGLPNLNIDNHHVIRAHINALDILTQKNISDDNHPVIKTLISELREVCSRYHTKYKNHQGHLEEWSVE